MLVFVEIVGRNKPGVMFTVPALAPGDYRVEVRTIMSGGVQVCTDALLVMLTVS